MEKKKLAASSNLFYESTTGFLIKENTIEGVLAEDEFLKFDNEIPIIFGEHI
jgi:hypothetical protein